MSWNAAYIAVKATRVCVHYVFSFWLRLNSVGVLAPLARILVHFVPLIGHQEINVLSYFPEHLAVANTCAIALLAFLARFRAFLSWG